MKNYIFGKLNDIFGEKNIKNSDQILFLAEN